MIKKILIFLLILTIFTTNVFAATIYFDIQEHWARDDIYWATNEANIFKGYEDYTFKPERNITRAEFITVLYRSAVNQKIFNNDFTGELDYSDINMNHWAYSYVLSFNNNLKQIENKSIKSIFNEDKFYPNRPITRQEAARIVAIISTEPLEEKKFNFTDLSQNYKYIEEINKLYSNNIIIGYNNRTFRPEENITRAESAKLTKNIYEDIFFRKNIFLKNVKYIRNYETYFPLFKNYDYSENTSEDDSYIKAVSTLEYLNFGGYIYPGDEHLYDIEPVKTLSKLHNNEYDNIIGTKYYILKYGKLDKESKVKFTETLLQQLYRNEELNHKNKMLILQSIFEYNKDPLLYSIIIDSLIEVADNIVDKFDLYFLKIEYLIDKEKEEILEENQHNNLKNIINYLENKNQELDEEDIIEINSLKKDEKFNIILYYKLNSSLIDYHNNNYEEGYEKLYQTYSFLKESEAYGNLLLQNEKSIIGALKNFKSKY